MSDSPFRSAQSPVAPEEAAPHELSPEEYAAAVGLPPSSGVPVGESTLLIRAERGEGKWIPEWHTIAWMIASGSSQRSIARELSYTEAQISHIVNKPEIAAKIKEIRDQHWSGNLKARFEATAPKALDFMTKVIEGTGEAQMAKISERLDASKWMLEKVTGKAKQEIDIDGGSGIIQLLNAVESLRTQVTKDPNSQEVREVLELSKGADDWMDGWVSENVPEIINDKVTGGEK